MDTLSLNTSVKGLERIWEVNCLGTHAPHLYTHVREHTLPAEIFRTPRNKGKKHVLNSYFASDLMLSHFDACSDLECSVIVQFYR